MFSLIITIISIALVAALALATLYYGGTAFNRGAAAAEASKLINEGQQINGAVTMYKADVQAGSTATVVTTLAGLVTSKYLSSVPASFADTTLIAGPATTTVTKDVYLEIVKKNGGGTFSAVPASVGTIVVVPGSVTAVEAAQDDIGPFTFNFAL